MWINDDVDRFEVLTSLGFLGSGRDLVVEPIIVGPVRRFFTEVFNARITTASIPQFVGIDGPSMDRFFDHDDLMVRMTLEELV